MAARLAGGTSNSTTREAGRSSRRQIVCPVRTSPPSEVRQATRALTMETEPPRAHGQSTACPASASTIPNDAVPIASNGRIACAAQPAKSARAWAPLNVRSTSASHERSPTNPKRASIIGCVGILIGRRISSKNAGPQRKNGDMSASQASASRPRVAPVSARPCSRSAALPSSSGCARGTGAYTHSRPCLSNPIFRNAGETTPIG